MPGSNLRIKEKMELALGTRLATIEDPRFVPGRGGARGWEKSGCRFFPKFSRTFSVSWVSWRIAALRGRRACVENGGKRLGNPREKRVSPRCGFG
jgi:hypothetical protein